MTDKYAVMGNPIAHSKSPDIHTAFARETGQDVEYDAILVEAGDFSNAVERFRADGGKGLNVTVPFKLDAWKLAGDLSPRASLAEAVNTLWFDTGVIHGDNTDGVGLVNDLMTNHGITLSGSRILLLGAGGAARGVLAPLIEAAPERLVIANRTASRAEVLAASIGGGTDIAGCGFNALDGQQFDLVINATAASLSGDLPPLPADLLAAEACCYDMMYGAEPTVFMQWAQENGARKVLDGLGMLVEQAAESFTIWRGVRPQTQPVIAMIREKLSAPS